VVNNRKTSLQTLKPSTLIYGVEPVRCPSFTEALKAGKPVTVNVSSTLADGLAVPQVGSNAFACAKDLVDKVVLVHDKNVALVSQSL
jgi:threonine dehydratase